jgi:hypothetical protein
MSLRASAGLKQLVSPNVPSPQTSRMKEATARIKINKLLEAAGWRFFSPATNLLYCKIFLEIALRDPLSGEIGKSLLLAVSHHHAAALAQILNELADRLFPAKYRKLVPNYIKDYVSLNQFVA